MKLEPIVHEQNTVKTANTGALSQSQAAAREKAIARLSEQPVQNATNIAPEEMGALRSQNQGQSASSEASAAQSAPQEDSQPKAATDEQPISPQYAILARKEKMFRQKVQQHEAALKAERDVLQTERESLKAKEAEYLSQYIPKSRLTEDTIGVLLEQGITYDQITQMALNQAGMQQDPATKVAIARLEAQIKSQQEAIERANKAQLDNQNDQYKQAVSQITAEANQLVRIDPNFEAIRETNSVKDVVDLIEKTFKADGILLSVEEAAKEVEDHLVDQLSKYSQKIKKLQTKFSQQSNAKSTAPAQQQPAANSQQSHPQKTLTNAVGSGRQLSAKERAILAFKGELK